MIVENGCEFSFELVEFLGADASDLGNEMVAIENVVIVLSED